MLLALLSSLCGAFACVASSWDALLHCSEWERVCASPVTTWSKYFCSATFFGSFVSRSVRQTPPLCLVLHERVMVANGSLLLQAYIDRHRWVVVGSSCSVASACVLFCLVVCVLLLSLRAGVVVSRRNAPSLPPMCVIHDMRACENAQIFCPCTAGRRHAENLLDPTTDVHGSCADVTTTETDRTEPLSLRDVRRGLLLVPKHARLTDYKKVFHLFFQFDVIIRGN